MSICAHSLVKNEERYLWFSVMSIIEHVDQVLLWDTGSTDGSVEIEKLLQKRFPDKIKVRFFNNVDKNEFTKLRQKMLEETKADWVILLDGDEIWWEDSIAKLRTLIEKKDSKIDSIVSPFINSVGDIYHYQDESAGMYNIDGRVGNFTIRAFRKDIPGLHFENPYGKEGLFYENGTALQGGESTKREFCDAPFLHFTHLKRSKGLEYEEQVLMRSTKFKYEKGISFPLDFYYPEVFFRPRPDTIKSPWETPGLVFATRATIETPLRKIKRTFQ